ncbi:MAG: enterobactin/ferric enterobactin esterase [Alphaproteobacteria bacterium]|nr:enterobactin/ferric enterobactin esterase [Alphaproteobacteria bacterium]
MKFWTACSLALVLTTGAAMAAEPRKPGEYPPTIDSIPQPGVAKGKLIGPLEFKSKIIEGTVRRYWIYVPAGYDAKDPPNLLVFQDGQRATNPQGPLNIPVVLDNLIARGDIPKTIGIFITPGNTGTEHYPDNLGTGNPNHRAPEYDALSDAYGRMLIDEIMPEVAKKYAFSSDPKKRAIGGTSSGAICAWTVAWNRPDAFGNVISMIGSYTSIGYHPATTTAPAIYGGDTYPGLIRREHIRPIRIFLQDGTADLNNMFGNWHLANEQMVSALQWANANADEKKDAGPRYDVRFEWGDGAHSDVHGGWLLPGILRWMFGK